MRHVSSTMGTALSSAVLALSMTAVAVAWQATRPARVSPSPTLASTPPADERTVVLFGGGSFDGWRNRNGEPSAWVVQDDGSIMVRGGDAITRDVFRDFQLHLEFFLPSMPDKSGQARANSGVYLHGRYEVQVLDTEDQPPFGSGCGAIYSIAPPLVNASRPAGHWQTYDIVFRAPRFADSGIVAAPARVTVLQNGIVIHNNLALPHTTPGGLDREIVAEGPLLLQDHGDPIRYRNVWIRHLTADTS